MNPASSPPTPARLELLEGFLREDPENPMLLADACETAIACGRHERALALLDTAQRLGLDAPEWTFRRAQLCIARRELDQAAALLEGLRRAAGEHPAISHDLAYVAFLQGDMAACRRLLAPWLEGEGTAHLSLDAAQLEPMQALWLRAMHRGQWLEEAWSWVENQTAARKLLPVAQGVASLLAIDTDHLERALGLADAALAVRPAHHEALVARATVALAQGANAAAQQLLQRALQSNGEDGRTWSTLGFASLQARNMPQAQAQLERAVGFMPGHIGTWHALGWARLLQGNQAGALEAFRQALGLDRNFAESHGAVGLVLAVAGQTAEARHHLEVAQRLDPANVTGRYALAVLSGDAGDVARLSALAAKLLDRPGFFGARLGEVFARQAGRGS